MSKRVLRVGILVAAFLIVLAPFAVLATFLRARQDAAPPAGAAAPIVVGIDSPQGLERTLLGVYLGMRDAELHKPAGADAKPVRFIVQEGDSAEVIAGKLQAAGLVSDAGLFRQFASYQGVGQILQAGVYDLRATMTMEEILEALQHSRKQEIRVTVREGWRLEQIAEFLAKNHSLSTYDDLLRAMRSVSFNYGILADKPSGVHLEGYLYPDTYWMDPRWTAEQVVDLLVRTMDSRFTPAMRQQAVARNLNVHKALIIASLVERETLLASERPIVASVYLNRIAKGMPLEADATVQYALGYDATQQRWWPNIKIEQLRSTESPYNTYLRRDLPPGPVCSPGLASLQAVLQPAKTDYLYYYAKGDGSHAFAKTFDEHLQNQKKYQK